MPSLKEIIVSDEPAQIPVIALQGDSLELTIDELETMKYLSSDSVYIEGLRFEHDDKRKIDESTGNCILTL
ncbi:unnamed protein product [Strongylus vulgaris]|uniref:Uncharacterized protein n=1 Tax=Strongylus vulgaris TaxID=40348 RepID=A0A3P7JI92_STRVU|nr:unnamed protein product [Strongylus vulgaris]